MNCSSQRLRSLTGSLALYSSFVSSVSAIDVKQLAVASHTAPAPDVHLRLGIDFTRRQLDRGRTHVRLCVRTHAGPWRLAANNTPIRRVRSGCCARAASGIAAE